MFKYICCVALAALLLVPSAMAAEPEIVLTGTGLEVRPVGGSAVQLTGDDVRIGTMPYNPARYAIISKAAGKKAGLQPSLLVFSAKGQLLNRFPFSQAEDCRGLSLSPDGKVLAIALEENGEHALELRSYPFFALLDRMPTHVRAESPSHYWAGDHSLVYTSIRDSDLRDCKYSPCGILSVRLLNPLKAEGSVLSAGTEQCDQMPDGLEGSKLTIRSICAAKPEDWSAAPLEGPVKKKTVDLGAAAQKAKAVAAKSSEASLSSDTDEDVRRKVRQTARLLLLTDLFCGTQSGDTEADMILQGLVWRYGTKGMKEYAGMMTSALQEMHTELEEMLADNSQKARQEKQCKQNLQKREQALQYFTR